MDKPITMCNHSLPAVFRNKRWLSNAPFYFLTRSQRQILQLPRKCAAHILASFVCPQLYYSIYINYYRYALNLRRINRRDVFHGIETYYDSVLLLNDSRMGRKHQSYCLTFVTFKPFLYYSRHIISVFAWKNNNNQ